MEESMNKSHTFISKESYTEEEISKLIDNLLNRHFKVYDRLAEI